MPTCSRCLGEGQESYEEDNRLTTEVCWHCAGSGEVEPEVDLQDRLLRVAYALAHQAETEYRKNRDNDPEGEGYDFCAAEEMMTPHDYFQSRVSDRKFKLLAQIQQLDSVIQNALLDWRVRTPAPTEPVPSPNGRKPGYVIPPTHVVIGAEEIRAYQEVNFLEEISEDDIPF